MEEQRLDDIRKKQKNLTKKQEELYDRQRTIDRIQDGIGTYFYKTQQLIKKSRETFRKNDGGSDFDEIYTFFSRDSGRVMNALNEEKREIKRSQLSLSEQEQVLTKEKQTIYSKEKKHEH